MNPLIEVSGITAGYGGPPVLRDIRLDVAPGEWITLLGANAAGKTTLLKCLIGVLPVSGGSVRFDGRPVETLAPEDRIRAGMAIVPEDRRVFGRMSVLENLRLGAHLWGGGSSGDLDRVFTLFPRMAERRSQKAATLSGGEQQMLAIGRALMARPKLLLLDEPSMGLAPKLVSDVFALLRRVQTEGVSILLVEQNAKMALAASSRAYVLRLGEIVLSGPSAELAGNEEVQRAYLGG
ncbi:ABC transporter ATP-binding protein [bacterium]|nr:ABC transporter ATP-binding protein [bacterium]